ncbi:hypothetical protein Tco_0362687 [Tanacetum coccineum]
MASLDHRLNPLFSIKECSSCGSLYTADFCCSKGGLEDKILVPKPPQNCATCGDPVDGLYCRPCAFKEEEKRIAEEQPAKDRYLEEFPICYDDDEEYHSYHTDLPTKETWYALSMGDEILTLFLKGIGELIKSRLRTCSQSSESEVTSDKESECDVPVNDESFTTFSNPLFDSKRWIFTLSVKCTLSDEERSKRKFKLLTHLFVDEEIISPKIDPHYFNAESNLIESLLNHDILIDSSPNGESKSVLLSNLLYDNSSPRPPEELNLEIADTIFESFSPSTILVEYSDSLMEEIDLFLASNDSMPPGIEDDDYDSEGDIHFLEEFLNNDSLPLPENESSNLDHFNDLSPSRPPLEPPDVEICFNFKPDTGVVTNKVVGDISEHDVFMSNLLPTQPTLCPVFDLLLSFSSENEDKVFNPDILISPLLSHRGKIISNFSKSPMMIFGGDIPHLDVPFLHFYPL